MGMLARRSDADVIVIGLVGERGREVRESSSKMFWGRRAWRAQLCSSPPPMNPR